MSCQKKSIGCLLSGTFRGKACRLSVECYPKTPEIKATLLPVDGSPPILLTQNLGQPMPLYRAFLADGILELGNTDFMDFAEQNDLGDFFDIKRYDTDVLTGRTRKTAVVFQFNRAALRKYHLRGCVRYEQHSRRLKRRPASWQHQAMGA